MSARIAIVGCGATKLSRPAPARELYTGPLFRAARAHVERLGCPWWVLSAEYGLVEAWREIPPYDRTVAQLRASPDEWSTRTRISAGTFGMSLCHGTTDRVLGSPAAVIVEVHAGAAYVEWLREIIARAPLTHHSRPELAVTIEDPLRGLEIGQRLHWYAERRDAPAGPRLDGWDHVAAALAPPTPRQQALFGRGA